MQQPIVLWDDDEPVELLHDPSGAVVVREVNGEESLEFSLSSTHEHADLIRNERIVEAAGEKWWTRKVTTERSGFRGGVTTTVFCEARFYELGTAGEVAPQEFTQELADEPMAAALQGTGWTIGVIDKTTRRTFEFDGEDRLEALRKVQEHHGGDLVFDNEARTVSLLVQQGEERGVGFFKGNGLTDSKRVEDTTSLVTRIIPRNEDGLGIESVNGGLPYVEDFSWTSEIREAVYRYEAGTAPETMLSMATAAVANRAQPRVSYDATVEDLSMTTGDQLDRFGVGDRVTIVDEEVGIETTQRIVAVELDLVKPWKTGITLSSTLRELGDSTSNDDGERLTTGSRQQAFDLVPFNLLRNARFDNDLTHWAHQGAQIVEAGRDATGDQAVRFAGTGTHMIEQTVAPDNRDTFTVSFDMESSGGSQGWAPNVVAEAVVTYEDGSTETIPVELK